MPCICRRQTRYGKEGACPPSRQAQDKFACRREGRPDHFSSLKTVRVLRDLFVAFVINKRSSLLFARWCWEIFSLAAMAALCSLPVRRSEAGCPASVVDRKILKPCQIIPFRAIMLIGPIRGCRMKSPYWAQNSQSLNFWLPLTPGTPSVRVKRQDGSGKLLLPAPCFLLLTLHSSLFTLHSSPAPCSLLPAFALYLQETPGRACCLRTAIRGAKRVGPNAGDLTDKYCPCCLCGFPAVAVAAMRF